MKSSILKKYELEVNGGRRIRDASDTGQEKYGQLGGNAKGSQQPRTTVSVVNRDLTFAASPRLEFVRAGQRATSPSEQTCR